MLKNTFLIIVLSLLIAGCTAPKQLSRKEWLEVTTRHYTDVTTEDVLLAAEKLFRLADGDDFKFYHTKDSLSATRNWVAYMVIAAAGGTDYWKIQVASIPNGVTVTIQVNTSAWALIPMSPNASPVQGTAIYDVFWARLEYLLGKRTEWMSCKEANKRISEKLTYGDNSALCNSFNVADKTP